MDQAKNTRDILKAAFGEEAALKFERIKKKVEAESQVQESPKQIIKRSAKDMFPEGMPFGSEGRAGYIANHYPARAAELLDRVVWTPIQMAVISKIVNERRSGVVIGANGTGKTLMLYQCEINLGGRNVYFRDSKAISIFDRIRAAMAEHKDVLKFVGDQWVDDRPLFIDEIDKAFGSQTEFIYFNELIDQRYKEKFQTVIFGNFKTFDECIAKIGLSAFDRLTNNKDGFKANLKSASFRQEALT